MKKAVYFSVVTDAKTKETRKAYVYAFSVRQAVRLFCRRFSYPPYIIGSVKTIQ